MSAGEIFEYSGPAQPGQHWTSWAGGHRTKYVIVAFEGSIRMEPSTPGDGPILYPVGPGLWGRRTPRETYAFAVKRVAELEAIPDPKWTDRLSLSTAREILAYLEDQRKGEE